MRSDKPIRLLIHPYPAPLCINTLPHPSCILTVRWAPWHRGAFAFDRPPLTCRTFPGGDETLTCLTQSGRPISQQHLLLAKDPSPILISNRLGNGNSQRDKTCRLLFSQDSFSAKLTSLPNGASCLCAATTAVFATAGCVFKSLLCFEELAVSSVYVLATKMQKSAVTPIFASLFLSNCFYLCFLCTVCTSYSPHPQQNHSYVLRFSILTQTLW